MYRTMFTSVNTDVTEAVNWAVHGAVWDVVPEPVRAETLDLLRTMVCDS